MSQWEIQLSSWAEYLVVVVDLLILGAIIDEYNRLCGANSVDCGVHFVFTPPRK